MNVDAVVVAAGRSERFGGQDKLFADLGGLPVLAWSVRTLLAAPSVASLLLVVREPSLAEERLRTFLPPERVRIVTGGARRRDSVEAGLLAATTPYVLVHDGARPFVTVELVERVIAAAEGEAAAIAAVPVVDTIKVVGPDGYVTEHPDRSRLWAAQTPQVVRRELWLEAARLSDADETDDAALVARIGGRTKVVRGEQRNLKITHPEDLLVARSLLAAWSPGGAR